MLLFSARSEAAIVIVVDVVVVRRGKTFCCAVVQLWYTARREERLSVVEYIYHSKMFFRSIWKAKRVPETWWGFAIRISYGERKEEHNAEQWAEGEPETTRKKETQIHCCCCCRCYDERTSGASERSTLSLSYHYHQGAYNFIFYKRRTTSFLA